MRRPRGPFIELNFYFHDRPEAEALVALVEALVARGASFVGAGEAHIGPDLRDFPFDTILVQCLTPVSVEGMQALVQHTSNPDMRLIQVYLNGATGLEKETAEIVTYLSISREASIVDKHPLAIWANGDIFSSADAQEQPKQRRKAGRQLYRRFRELLAALRPTYAAITMEWDLECPTDLRRDPRSLAFRNFYVSTAALGMQLDSLQHLFAGAYVETVGEGLYISCSPDFNPEGRGLAHANTLGVAAAKLIAAAF